MHQRPEVSAKLWKHNRAPTLKLQSFHPIFEECSASSTTSQAICNTRNDQECHLDPQTDHVVLQTYEVVNQGNDVAIGDRIARKQVRVSEGGFLADENISETVMRYQQNIVEDGAVVVLQLILDVIVHNPQKASVDLLLLPMLKKAFQLTAQQISLVQTAHFLCRAPTQEIFHLA